ncbi:MAG TPA: magnesium transporter [Planctomycetota bacterium]|nr:magnesium transporter [Planctomycetota bacterium]
MSETDEHHADPLRTSRRIDVEQFKEIVRKGNWQELREALEKLPLPDIADLLIELPVEDEGVIYRLLPREEAGQVLAYMPPERQEELIHSFSNADVHTILNQMPPDDRTRLLEEMPHEVTRRILESLSPEELKFARELLGYPEGTAGRYMTPEYVALRPDVTAKEALEIIRTTGRGKETLNIRYVVDESGKLIEDVRLGSLVLAEPDTRVIDIKDVPLVSIPATVGGDDVLKTFDKYDRVALPVTDSEGHMVGIITADDILDLAQKEATEDIQKLGGLEALDAPYLEVNFWSMLRKRVGWLSVLFIGETLTATVMGFFEDEIQRAVILAIFLPLIISSGGNSGSQATSLMIRSLALRELGLKDWRRVLGREILSGLVLGGSLGAIGFLRIVLWQHLEWGHYGSHYALVALTVFVSLIGVVTWGTISGSMLPFLLRRLGFDPATSSAPFVATLVDVTGLCIYFLMALLILRGTLL